MIEFTFICICYNQESCIINHLESIKKIIKKYGTEVHNHLIIADDCSKDRTVEKTKKWIEENEGLFLSTKLIVNENNIGSVKNLLNAVDCCRTKDFKILAADDMYFDNNIYDLYENMAENIIITPVIPACKLDSETRQRIKSMKRSFKMVAHYRKKNKLDILLRIKNHIMAPGVFVPCKYWYDESLRKQLDKFTFIEDVPMWMYLIVEKKIKTTLIYEPYIIYSLPTVGRRVDGKTINELRQKDCERLTFLYSRHRVNVFEKIKYNLNKVVLTFSHKYDAIFFKSEGLKEYYIDFCGTYIDSRRVENYDNAK